jgi:hypothetical protein
MRLSLLRFTRLLGLVAAGLLLLTCSAPAATSIRGSELTRTNSLEWSNLFFVVIYPYPHPNSTNPEGGTYSINASNLAVELSQWITGVGGGDANGTNARLYAINGTATNLTAKPSASDQIPLIIRGISGQDANLFNVHDGNGTLVWGLAYDGSMVGEGANSPRLSSTATAGYVWTAVGTTGIGAWSAVVVPHNTTTQRVDIAKNSGATLSSRKRHNFIEGANVTLTIADDAGNDETDITIATSGGVGEANVNGEVSITNAVTIGLVYGKAGITNLLRSLQAGNMLNTTNQGTNIVFAIADAELLALGGLTSAADTIPYFTGAGAAATSPFTTQARQLLDDTSFSAMRTTLGLVIGTDVQGFSTLLNNLAGLASTNQLVFTNDIWLLRFSSNGVVVAAGTGLGVVSSGSGIQQTFTLSVTDAELLAFAGLTSAADKLPYFTGSGTAALADFTGTARNLLDDGSASAMRTTLGLVIGTDVIPVQNGTANNLVSTNTSVAATNGNNVVFKPANSNAIPVTNIWGQIESGSAATLFLDCNLAQNLIVTNRITAATTIVATNISPGQQISIIAIGEASGGTSRTLTIATGAGGAAMTQLDLDTFGVTPATSTSLTLTNGNAVEINLYAYRTHPAAAAPTNMVNKVSRQYKF